MKSVNDQFQFTTYVPPGPKKYCFVENPKAIKPRIRTIIIKPRDKEIQLDEKVKVFIQKVKRKFIKAKSVFWNFREDSQATKEKAFQYDWNYSKISRFIKDNFEVPLPSPPLFFHQN